jgi:hypothetical protein
MSIMCAMCPGLTMVSFPSFDFHHALEAAKQVPLVGGKF